MLIPLILIFGCVVFIFLGAAATAYAGMDMLEEGPDIRNIIMFLVGIGIAVFGCFSIVKASDYYHEKESPKTEIITSVPAQIDTTITIKNGVADTLYTYHLTEEK